MCHLLHLNNINNHSISVVVLHLEVGYSESSLKVENRMILSKKKIWTRPWKEY